MRENKLDQSPVVRIIHGTAFFVFLFPSCEISGREFEKDLSHLAERWLDPSRIEVVLTEVEGFRKDLERDKALANSLREFLKKAERTRSMEPASIAAGYDIIGDFEAAHSRYQRIRSDAAFLHQIRLYQQLNPDWDQRPLDDDDLGALYNSGDPAFRIARIEAFIRFLESRPAKGEVSLIGSGSHGAVWSADLVPGNVAGVWQKADGDAEDKPGRRL